MEQPLFAEFPKITKKDWVIQATKDLKGKSFENTLLWHSLENFDIQPYYSKEDLENVPFEEIQSTQKNKKSGTWQNRPLVRFTNENETNALIISHLQKGADAIILDLCNIQINQLDWLKLFNNVKLSESPIYFKTNEQIKVLDNLAKFIHYQPKGGFQNDIIATFFEYNSFNINSNTWKNTKELVEKVSKFPHFQVLTVESHIFHNAGANAVQELAFTLASAVENLDKLTDLELTPEQIVPKIEFSISIGTNYFIEIAKLRALRYLWSKILASYNCSGQLAACFIHCQTSSFYDANLSPYTNMLRATTEAMSAVMGGCDALTILPYDAVADQNSELGERIARNISIIMKEEAYLDKTIDPSAGSYYIENLTFQLANEVWKLFQKVESFGGIIAAFEQGFIEKEINNSFEKKVKNLHDGKVMVGVNKFREESGNLEKLSKKSQINKKTLQNRRLSEAFE